MPIRPIDMLSMPNRSQEASQVHKAENNKMTQTQERLEAQFNTNVKHDAKQTARSTKSENKEYRYQDGKGNSAEYSGQQKKEKKKQEESRTEIKTSKFDLRI